MLSVEMLNISVGLAVPEIAPTIVAGPRLDSPVSNLTLFNRIRHKGEALFFKPITKKVL